VRQIRVRIREDVLVFHRQTRRCDPSTVIS
jgi:hypothetical protein